MLQLKGNELYSNNVNVGTVIEFKNGRIVAILNARCVSYKAKSLKAGIKRLYKRHMLDKSKNEAFLGS